MTSKGLVYGHPRDPGGGGGGDWTPFIIIWEYDGWFFGFSFTTLFFNVLYIYIYTQFRSFKNRPTVPHIQYLGWSDGAFMILKNCWIGCSGIFLAFILNFWEMCLALSPNLEGLVLFFKIKHIWFKMITSPEHHIDNINNPPTLTFFWRYILCENTMFSIIPLEFTKTITIIKNGL